MTAGGAHPPPSITNDRNAHPLTLDHKLLVGSTHPPTLDHKRLVDTSRNTDISFLSSCVTKSSIDKNNHSITTYLTPISIRVEMGLPYERKGKLRGAWDRRFRLVIKKSRLPPVNTQFTAGRKTLCNYNSFLTSVNAFIKQSKLQGTVCT